MSKPESSIEVDLAKVIEEMEAKLESATKLLDDEAVSTDCSSNLFIKEDKDDEF
jgi:hypothetical protein